MKPSSGSTSRPVRPRGFTLAELMVSLSVLTILTIAATNLIIAGLHTDRVLLDTNRQSSELELATRRIIRNIRTGTALVLTGSNSLTLTSQADPTNNGQTYTVTYTYDSSAKTLSESSTQFGVTPPVNIIAYNVTAFTFTQVTASPLVLSIDITIAGASTSPPSHRTFQVLNRNS
jgi:prepilin-type N-terminal cleavage/methylation domain-containing protein